MRECDKYLDVHHDPDYVDEITAGIIDFSDIMHEREISNISNRPNFKSSVGQCKIEVYGNEGGVPHFHIFSLDKKFNTCVCIYSNNYFSHGQYTDIFNARQRVILDKWLRLPNKSMSKASNWEMIVSYWETSNGECKFPNNRKVKTQPDYTAMNTFKDNS